MLKFLAERKQWSQFNRMQDKNLKGDPASSWKKARNSIQQNGRREMLTDEQAPRWKKGMNSIQQNGRKQMLTDEIASSWKKAMNSIQQNGRKEMLTDEQASSWKKQWTQFNRMEERKCSRTNKLLAERKQ